VSCLACGAEDKSAKTAWVLYVANRLEAKPKKVAANPRAIIAVATERQRLQSSTPAALRTAHGTIRRSVQIAT
jgi:hypothetical protein